MNQINQEKTSIKRKLIFFILILSLPLLLGYTHNLRKMNLKGKIAFGGPGHRIWIMDLSTGKCKKVPTNIGAVDPALSPDGKKVAYCCGGLWVGNIDGSDHKELSSKGISRHPTWSPDGKKIAFSSNRRATDKVKGIYIISVEGENETLITKPTESLKLGRRCSWSPDGEKIVFGSDGLYVVNIDGFNRRKLVRGRCRSPDWSPDGKKIVYVFSGQIYTITPEGTDRIQLTTTGKASCLHWSPNGKRIIFTLCNKDYIDNIYIMDDDGSHQTRLTNFKKPYSASSPQWSPDGRKIFYWVRSGLDSPATSLYVMNPDGKNKKRLLKFSTLRALWGEFWGI